MMKIRFKLNGLKRVFLVSLFMISISISADTGALVQYQVERRNFASEEIFTEHLRMILREVLDKNKCDLIVFPEYLGVFTQLFNSELDFREAQNFSQVVKTFENAGYQSTSDFFIKNDNSQLMDRIFGTLSRDFNVAILAGTSFVPEKGKLRNRAFFYNSEGERSYYQDKVYTTDFERTYLNLDSGDQNRVDSLPLENKKIVLTICRDTYFESWDTYWKNVDLWIDISANEAVYGPVTLESSSEALLERLQFRPGTIGISVCLVGSFLDFIWQGISSVHFQENNGLRAVKQSRNPVKQSIFYFEY